MCVYTYIYISYIQYMHMRMPYLAVVGPLRPGRCFQAHVLIETGAIRYTVHERDTSKIRRPGDVNVAVFGHSV